ncbi:MAG: RND transporter [Flavobacteriales bacterium]|nr:MAG: RND transporter [Flavobacteriales bacterium]
MGENKKIQNFANWVVKRRWFVLLGAIILVMSAGSGGRFLTFNNDYHIFFDEDNPQVIAFDELQDKYTKDDNAFIVVVPKSGNVFTKETLAAVEELEQMAWQVPYSTRVDALSNYQHTRSVGDDMYVENLASDIENKSDSALQYIKTIALREPALKNRIVNEEGTVTAINVTVNLPMDSMNAPMEVMAYVRTLVDDWNEKYPEFDTYISGIVMMNGSFAELSMGDMMTLVPLMFLVILLVVFLTTRSISSMFTSLFVLFFSIMTAMGLAGWMGVELTGPSSSAPTMIMTLAIADSIHLLVTMLQLMRKGMPKREAIVESVRINFMPVFITSITTIIGFLTLNFAEGAPFHDLGNITAMGVAAAFFLSIVLLPALVAILPFKVKIKEEKEGKTPLLDKLANFVISKYKPILVVSVIAVLGISYLSLKNELNNKFVEFFDESVPFRSDTDFISDNLTGIYNLEYSLGSGEADGISNPSYLNKLDEFEQWFKAQPEVVHVNSFSEVMRRVNASMHGDDVKYYKVPENKQQAAQFLLLYEMSLPYGLDLNNQINVDKSETRFTVTLKNISSNEMIALTAKAEQWLRDNAPETMFSHGISTALMFSHITKTNMDSMLQGGLGALILISLILIFALRSFKYGMISLIPNITPIAVAFGIWFMIVGEINMAVTVVLGMTLGIVVDDTIHLLSKYIRARRELNKSPEDAIRYAFQTVGRAIIVTTIVLTAGFSVLMQSNFGFNSDMGKLTAITIVVALILDLLLLPALLLTIDKVRTKIKNNL